MTAGISNRLALLALAALLGACASNPGPTPSARTTPAATPAATPGASPMDVYRSIAADVITIRGLQPATSIDPKVINRSTLEANITAEFDKSNPAARIAITERVYRLLGLLPATTSLRDVYLALQGSQVIGYYDPSVDELFLVSSSGSLGPTERVTYAHEFTHQLQDGSFDLESLGLEDHPDRSDRNLAVLALVEGDAVSAQTTWMQSRLTATELARIAADAADPALLDIMARTPAILLETSLFPYTAGASFVNQLILAGGYEAVNTAYRTLPESTEQVINPEKYTAREHPAPVALPAGLADLMGPGAGLESEDTLGELQLRVWLKENGVPGDLARAGAEGWGGDRAGLFHAPGGDVLVLASTWDTNLDADEFKAAAANALDHLAGGAGILGRGNQVAIVIDRGDTLGSDAMDAVLGALIPG
ncbi:MAG: hypothetical protein ABIV26_02440 [Candidatus Limnocylindrales bacterium]